MSFWRRQTNSEDVFLKRAWPQWTTNLGNSSAVIRCAVGASATDSLMTVRPTVNAEGHERRQGTSKTADTGIGKQNRCGTHRKTNAKGMWIAANIEWIQGFNDNYRMQILMTLMRRLCGCFVLCHLS